MEKDGQEPGLKMENERLNKDQDETLIRTNDTIMISQQISREFDVYDIPFFDCDFDIVYPDIASILPGEAVSFSELSLENSIACEVICAAVCHQMNWDFLRRTVLNRTKTDECWMTGERLLNISEEEVGELFVNYNKPERVRAKERCEILHDVGKMICDVGKYKSLFLDQDEKLLPIELIRNNLLKCAAFSKDPKEKKLQLLLQKLSNYDKLRKLSIYCKPAIDYHLIRCYLRRGLIYPKTTYAEGYIKTSETERKETTVGALRHLCSKLLEDIAWYTELDICTINSIEWNVGRSVCTQDNPDCYLDTDDANWLKAKFARCPFFKSCMARQNEKNGLLHINEPCYRGTSY